MPVKAAPVRYVLYSHYFLSEGTDFLAHKGGRKIEDLRGLNDLLNYARGLRELLTAPGHEGLLVLFYASGYERYLEAFARGEDPRTLTKSGRHDDEGIRRMCFAEEAAEHVRERLNVEGLADRIRFLTWADLHIILGRANQILAGTFLAYFIGGSPGIRYDAPKVVEAILRLRFLGNGVPVLRLDQDVLFRDNQGTGDLGLFKAIACSVMAYQLRLAEPSVSTFLFSASYNSRALQYPTTPPDPLGAWSRAFATRVYPALVCDFEQIKWIWSLPDDRRDEEWDNYATTNLHEDLVRQYYGLTPVAKTLEAAGPYGISGLTKIGAHPLHSVISGALLCLSEGAILDLPPFSNLSMNVMWIDDHLKYSLHRAMNHFTSSDPLDLGPGLSDARMDDVTVTKARPPITNLPVYVLGSYLPTLFFGTLMDAWITKDPILKVRVDTLDEDGRLLRRKAVEDQRTAPLPSALLDALATGTFNKVRENELRATLERYAIQRANETRQVWASLKKSDDRRTFASLWATGDVKDLSYLFDNFKGGQLWEGIKHDGTIRQLIDLGAPMLQAVTNLISDTVGYVQLVLAWPTFVQIVRSIQQGDFAGDLSWSPVRGSSRPA